MILTLIWILILLLVAGVLIFAVRKLLVPEPWSMVAQLVIGLIFLLLIINLLLPYPFLYGRVP